MEIEIKKLVKEDADEFWEVFANVLQAEFNDYDKQIIQYFLEKIYTKDSFLYWLEVNSKTVFLAKTQGKVVGFAVIDEPYGGVSFCRWLGVEKEYQKNGIGRKLINAWIDLAGSQGCHKVELAARIDAKAFYEKVGLQAEGERKFTYFGIDQFMFGKIIGQIDIKSMIK